MQVSMQIEEERLKELQEEEEMMKMVIEASLKEEQAQLEKTKSEEE